VRNWLDLVKDQSGATAIEYGMLAGLISVVILTALQFLQEQLLAIWEAIIAANLSAVAAG
jgi:pilus assembly protein Flp/PilA